MEITGTVADLSGGPVAHALVRVDRGGQPPGPAIETDDGGRFSLWATPGEVKVTAEADGYVGGSDYGVAPGTFKILLTPESSLSGTVVDSKTNEPVAGIEVDVSRNLHSNWVGTPGDITDEAGRFRIGHLMPDRYTVIVRAPRSVGSAEGSTLVGLGEHVSGVVVRLHPALQVEGKVVVAGNPQKPCKEPRMWLNTPVANVSLFGVGDPDGTVRIDHALPGTYEVRVRCSGFVSVKEYPPVEVKDKDVGGLVWEVTEGATIRGRVLTNSGTPIGGANVNVTSHGTKDVVSDRDGRYELTAVPAGKHKLIVFSKGRFGPPDGWTVDVGERAVVEKDLVLDDAGTIHGTIIDTDGKPMGGAWVSLIPVADWDLDVCVGTAWRHAGDGRRNLRARHAAKR